MALLENIGLFFRPPDFRSARQVEDEVREEFEFHIAMRSQANQEAGMSPVEARTAAEEKFGDLESIRGACARIQIGERRVLQRVQFGLMVVVLGAVAFFGWQLTTTRAQTAEMVGELRGDIGELTAALRDTEVGEPAAARFIDTDGDGLPDQRVTDGGSVRSPVETAQSEKPVTTADWLARFSEGMRWSEIVAIGDEIAALPDEQALALMKELYPALPTVFARRQILKSFVFHGGHPIAAEVLHLAALDPDLAVQGWAFGYLRDYAFGDFSDDYEGYLAWRARYAEMPVDELLTRNAQELAARLSTLDGELLSEELRKLEGLDLSKGRNAGVDLAAVLRDAGLLDSVRGWLSGADDESRSIAVNWLKEIQPDEAWLRMEIAPLLRTTESFDSKLVSAACGALGAAGNGWAVEPLLDSLRWAQPDQSAFVFHHALALAEIGDPRSIPSMIALIVAEDSYDTIYGIGYFGLEKLTGVRYDEAHDGAFWRNWWQENRHRMAPEIRDTELPELNFHR